MNRVAGLRRSVCALLLAALMTTLGFAVAKWEVDGAGFLQNRKLRQQLDLISGGEKDVFNASDIEDAALVLLSFLQRQGYLNAEADVILTHQDGNEERIEWGSGFEVFLPRDTRASVVRFELKKGVRFYYDSLRILGDPIESEDEVESFFYSQKLAFQGDEARIYTPEAMNSSAANLQSHLQVLGYRDALVFVAETKRNRETGAVDVEVEVEPGSHYVVSGVEVEVAGTRIEGLSVSEYSGQSFSRFLSQDLLKKVRNAYYRKGYAEVNTSVTPRFGEIEAEERKVELVVRVESGEQIRLKELSFSGHKETRDSVIRNQIELEEGDLFNPLLVDRSRLALGRLGIFEEVTLDVEDAGDSGRSVDFELKERSPWAVDLLFGWGSYEQLRGGLIAERTNIWGRAHLARFTGTLSMKSDLAELRYVLPDLFKTNTTASTRAFALNREEVNFDREEVGANVGLSRRFDRLAVESTLLYTFESLKAANVAREADSGSLEEAKVGSLQLRLGRDRRDSPLNPRDGNRAFSKLEVASQDLGGEVDYQRLEIGFSSHGDLGGGLYWHGGVSHGVIGSIDGNEREVPTNKLFFPGGESSIRGFTSGEASPARLTDGVVEYFGARSFLLANLELEQYLTDPLAVVLFVDALGVTRTLGSYPFDETLVSAGLGLRFKTFMGPIRLEYGHNVRKRDFDPDGAFHFSIGFPF